MTTTTTITIPLDCATCGQWHPGDVLERTQGACPAPYTIKGRASRGEETPRFDARLLAGTTVLADLVSDGTGGCARVRWTDAAPRDSAARTAAEAWLAGEAARLWAETGEEPTAWPAHEAALLVVPECLRRRRARG